MNYRLNSSAQHLRCSVLTGISLFFSCVALVLAVYHFSVAHLSGVALIEAFASCLSGYVYTLSKQKRASINLIRLYTYYLLLAQTLLMTISPIESGIAFWCALFPILLYLLLGVKEGLISSGILLVVNCSILYIRGEQTEPMQLYANFILCNVAIWIIAHLYEYNRTDVENSLLHLASRDPLTGAHNRLSLTSAYNRFNQSAIQSHFSLLVLDIDHFKAVNDEFGHDVGDKVLIDTSVLLGRLVGDANVFRIGGEEFCITLFGHSLSDAEEIAEQLRYEYEHKQFKTPDNTAVKLTLSIGVCQYSTGKKLSDLLKLADIELYRAKENGRNQVMICSCANENSQQCDEVLS